MKNNFNTNENNDYQDPNISEQQNMNGYQPQQNIFYQNNQNDQMNGQQNKISGMAIASMVLGIVSVTCFCAWYLSLSCAVIAVVFGGISLSAKKGGRNMALAGVIMGALGFILSIIYFIVIMMWYNDIMHMIFYPLFDRIQ